jgi:hypothetical protein
MVYNIQEYSKPDYHTRTSNPVTEYSEMMIIIIIMSSINNNNYRRQNRIIEKYGSKIVPR